VDLRINHKEVSSHHEPQQWFIEGMKKIMGANYEVNSPKITHNLMMMGQHWLGKTNHSD